MMLAKQAKIPPCKMVSIAYRGLYRRKPIPDPGNLSLAVKAAVDGFVDANVIPDDTWDYVASLTEQPPLVGKEVEDGLEIAVTPC